MIYQISSGQGPAECELGVAKFLEYLQKKPTKYEELKKELEPGGQFSWLKVEEEVL